MNQEEAFDIEYYDIIDNTISFKGRVLSDIKLGDKLIYLVNKENERLQKEYIVIKIIAYRNEFESINAGMTCEMVTSGGKLEFKRGDKLFFQYA